MTSVLKKWSQIEPRTKYFIATGAVTGYTLKTTVTVSDFITTAQDDYAGPSFDGVWTSAGVTIATAGALLKDMGRIITVYNDTLTGNPHTAIYRRVQVVNGASTEGVGGTVANQFNTYWIRVWSATGTGVAPVARTG